MGIPGLPLRDASALSVELRITEEIQQYVSLRRSRALAVGVGELFRAPSGGGVPETVIDFIHDGIANCL